MYFMDGDNTSFSNLQDGVTAIPMPMKNSGSSTKTRAILRDARCGSDASDCRETAVKRRQNAGKK
eukprot:CAMPEP_0184352158 /NCGR_PEP_ID=MMETSP1089-20130417/61592_1 /TAXON_ID=38269 ORGANISM="Gloeochaete wittrockiana, Strain SAG46.84" /NCGR_SAMPLE_ID=MMETSP1089 /ASSEMBLY_ACC=CAM_ASM_000445 /LENGTH=64 /DNA_ID=CAMNT_0026686329 /DNA_START=418 /DNA_END=609 /DNA_ORIENTATION=+